MIPSATCSAPVDVSTKVTVVKKNRINHVCAKLLNSGWMIPFATCSAPVDVSTKVTVVKHGYLIECVRRVSAND